MEASPAVWPSSVEAECVDANPPAIGRQLGHRCEVWTGALDDRRQRRVEGGARELAVGELGSDAVGASREALYEGAAS